MSQVDEYTQKVDTFMEKYTSTSMYAKFKDVEKTTGYPAAWFFVAAIGLVTSILTLIGGVKFLVDLVGFLYPAYMSFKALESSSNEDTQWLTYWVVFSFLFIMESIFSFVTKLIPFYYWIKAAGIVWMWYPGTRGALVIHEKVLRPTLLPFMESISSTTTTTKKE